MQVELLPVVATAALSRVHVAEGIMVSSTHRREHVGIRQRFLRLRIPISFYSGVLGELHSALQAVVVVGHDGSRPSSTTRLRDDLCRCRTRPSKSLDPAKLPRNWNGPLFEVPKEYEHVNSFAGTLYHSDNIGKRNLANDHGPLREFRKPSVSGFTGNDCNWFSQSVG
jgi:hypothetical protein